PIEFFSQLGENDILFIDSSHVLHATSDVRYEYLEILPTLKPGVLVHIHDILLPADYFRSWLVTDLHFWNEQYLLQAFLAFNESFRTLWAGSYMHLKHPKALERAFGHYDSSVRWAGSYWIRRER